MSSDAHRPTDQEAGPQRNGRKAVGRRRFLRTLMLAAPAAAAAGALAGVGTGVTLAKSQPASPLSPEETRALREKFLSKGRMELGAGARVVDSPAPGPGVEAVSTRPGFGESAPEPVATLPPEESALLRMQKELQRAMTKPRDQRKWNMVIDQIGRASCRERV